MFRVVLLLLDAVIKLATLTKLQDQSHGARQGLIHVD